MAAPIRRVYSPPEPPDGGGLGIVFVILLVMIVAVVGFAMRDCDAMEGGTEQP